MKIRSSRLVGLDLETTSLNPYAGDIIEIGACAYEDGKKVDEFQALIRIEEEVPRYVSAITGISNDDLKEGIDLKKALKNLEQFVGNSPIIGHNIWFDINFLKAKGLDFSDRVIYDSWKVASLVVDTAPSLSLEVLTRHLGISHVDTHRALDDAVASVELFFVLLGILDEYPVKQLQKAVDFLSGKEYTYLPLLEESLAAPKKKTQKALFNDVSDSLSVSLLSEEVESISDKSKAVYDSAHTSLITDLSDVLKSDGSSLFRVPSTVSEEHAALLTSSLQEQPLHIFVPGHRSRELILNSIPQEIQEITGKTVNPVYLGRAREYFCMKRFDEYLARESHSDIELHVIAKVFLWLQGTRTGLISELNVSHDEYVYIEAFRAHEELCGDQNENGSFYRKALAGSRNADVIVSYHDRYFEEKNTEKNRIVIGAEKFYGNIEQHKKVNGSLSYVTSEIQVLKQKLRSLQRDTLDDAEVLADRLQELEDHIALVYGLIAMKSRSFPEIAYERIVISNEYSEFLQSEGLLDSVMKVQDLYEQFNDALESSGLFTIHEDEMRYYSAQIKGQCSFFIEFFAASRHILKEVQLLENGVILRETPLLRFESFADVAAPVHLIGAHVSSFVEKELETFFDIDAMKLVNIASDIQLQERVTVSVVEDMPSDASDSYLEHIHAYVERVHAETKSGVLVLLKNRGRIQSYFKMFGHENKKSDSQVFYLGVAGSVSKVKGMLEGVEQPIVYATYQYLDDLDLDMSLYDTVILDRLPFQPPRTEEILTGESDFMTSALPRAVDVFGKIYRSTIAHAKDSAHFVILDPKAFTARYASYFFDEIGVDSFNRISTVSE